MAANIGYIAMLGQDGFMDQLAWEQNKWTYMAAGGAGLIILMALIAKKKKRRKRPVSSSGGPRSLSVQYQG